MAQVVVTAEVENGGDWENGFRTHADLFREQTVNSPVSFAINGNDVAIYFDVRDLDTYLSLMDSQVTADAMKVDGVKRETVKIYVLDRDLEL
jgi:hypothetical protein